MAITLKSHSAISILLVVLGTLIFAICNALVKEIGSNIPISMIVAIQSVICLLYCIPWISRNGWSAVRTDRIGLQIARGIAELIAIYPLYWSFQYIPLIDGLLLNNAAPIWVPLILYIVYRTRMQSSLWIGIALGFVGVVLILRPDTGIINWGSILAMISGIATGYVMVALGELGKTEPSERIIFYCFLTCLVIILPVVFLQWKTPTIRDLIFMILSGISLLMAMAFFNHAFRLGKTIILSPLFYLTVVFGGLIDWIVWHHVPSILTTLGCALVMLGGILTIILENRQKIEEIRTV